MPRADPNAFSCRSLAAPSATNVPSPMILAGILSTPRGSGAKRRAAIRHSWLQYPGVGKHLFACFVIGARGLSRRRRRGMDAKDILWLDVEEPGILTMIKVFAWWQAAARVPWISHAVKIDDDSYGEAAHP